MHVPVMFHQMHPSFQDPADRDMFRYVEEKASLRVGRVGIRDGAEDGRLGLILVVVGL